MDDDNDQQEDEQKEQIADEQEVEENEEEKQTFLSVWQEEHREQLAKKAKKEREEQEALIQAGKNALDSFNEKRRDRIEQSRKDQQAREADLRQDYDAVFATGTIWQQVAKLVDLTKKNEKRTY